MPNFVGGCPLTTPMIRYCIFGVVGTQHPTHWIISNFVDDLILDYISTSIGLANSDGISGKLGCGSFSVLIGTTIGSL